MTTEQIADNVKRLPNIDERFGERVKNIELYTGAGLMAAQDFDFVSLVSMAKYQQSIIDQLVELVGELGDLLDTLNMHAHNDVIPHWLCIPAGEWDQAKINEALTKVAALKEKV